MHASSYVPHSKDFDAERYRGIRYVTVVGRVVDGHHAR